MDQGRRLESRVLEERIQSAVGEGRHFLKVKACGQHGIGGRLWRAGDEPIYVKIHGSPGQRVGSMGFPNTGIEIMGPASDDFLPWPTQGVQPGRCQAGRHW
jgi:hypothetical protein